MLGKFILFNKQIKEHKKFTPETKYSRRFFFPWLNTLDASKTSLDYGLPWFTFQAIEYIKNQLPSNAKVFEYGGGGSTLFFMEKNCDVFTVEHNSEWFKNIQTFFEKNKTGKKWKGFLITAEEGLIQKDPKKEEPSHYFSTEKEFGNMNFKKYASKIDEFQDEFFDLVLIDGRTRPSCMAHSISKLKKGGLLVLDNTERAYYTEAFTTVLSEKFQKVVDVFGPVPYTMWFHKTTIWKKNGL
ncbi:MAG: hypothetical protein H0W84_02215 [Bacteroidetes bacterium]|nr:hypothetical protein [Bacteroidota bacterium]